MSLYEDAVILAKAVIKEGEWWRGDFWDYGDQKYHCKYCDATSYDIIPENPRSINHKSDCPVLVALGILTRSEEDEKL